MTAVKKKTVRLQILALLRESSIPMATPDIIAILRPSLKKYPRSQVWVVLRQMEEAGEVRQEKKKVPRDNRGERHMVTASHWTLVR